MQNDLILINRFAWVELWTLVLALNFGESLREFREILGKYPILDGRSAGSEGLKHLKLRMM